MCVCVFIIQRVSTLDTETGATMDRRGIRGVVPEDVGGEGVGRKDISCSRWPPSTYTYTHRHVGIIYFIMENPI